MPNDQESWLAWRREHLGSSDSPALFLKDYFFGPGDLFLRKTGRAPEEQPNEAMVAGIALEPAIRDWGLQELGVKGKANQRRVAKDKHKIHAATLDCLCDDGVPLEVKTVGLVGKPRHYHRWGEPGTDQIPEHVLIQVHHQMYVTGADHAHVAAFVAHVGLCLYHIPRVPELVEQIRDTGIKFWIDYVKPKKWPARGFSAEALRHVPRQEKTIQKVDPALIEAVEIARKIKGDSEKLYDEAKSRLIAAMRDARVADGGEGYGAELRPCGRTDVDREILKTQFPDAWAAAQKRTTYDRLNVWAPKGDQSEFEKSKGR